jgi:hypothetical protein
MAAWRQQDRAAPTGDDRPGSDLIGIPSGVSAVRVEQMGGTNWQTWAAFRRPGRLAAVHNTQRRQIRPAPVGSRGLPPRGRVTGRAFCNDRCRRLTVAAPSPGHALRAGPGHGRFSWPTGSDAQYSRRLEISPSWKTRTAISRIRLRTLWGTSSNSASHSAITVSPSR